MKSRSATPQKFILLSSVGVIITILTLFFGGAFLRALQKSYGSVAYWALGFLSAIAFAGIQSYAMVVILVGLWVSLGLQIEFEKRGIIWWVNGLLSLTAGFLLVWFGGRYVLSLMDLTSTEAQMNLLKEMLTQIQSTTNGLRINVDAVVPFLPSILAVTIILHLGFGLIFEKRVFHWFRLPRERYVSQVNLMEIKWPDFFLWSTLVSLLLTAVNFGNPWIAQLGLNLVVIFTVLYFFQGLAVTEHFLAFVKAGFFFRFLTYFFLIGQFFFVLSFVGFADFWLDFRQRMRKSQQLEKTDNSLEK